MTRDGLVSLTVRVFGGGMSKLKQGGKAAWSVTDLIGDFLNLFVTIVSRL